jgi:hypothetical protein
VSMQHGRSTTLDDSSTDSQNAHRTPEPCRLAKERGVAGDPQPAD